MAGLEPPIHATPAQSANRFQFCNIINYLIVGLSVLMDGRVKPGHDGKPKVGRYGATSNG
jgi:hypothetical protein